MPVQKLFLPGRGGLFQNEETKSDGVDHVGTASLEEHSTSLRSRSARLRLA
jgi:hypothetical protein